MRDSGKMLLRYPRWVKSFRVGLLGLLVIGVFQANATGGTVFERDTRPSESVPYEESGATLRGLSGPDQDYVVALVPDSGARLALLGLALAGFTATARKMSSKSNHSSLA